VLVLNPGVWIRLFLGQILSALMAQALTLRMALAHEIILYQMEMDGKSVVIGFWGKFGTGSPMGGGKEHLRKSPAVVNCEPEILAAFSECNEKVPEYLDVMLTSFQFLEKPRKLSRVL